MHTHPIVHVPLGACPITAQTGPHGWILDAVDHAWVGLLAPTLDTMLSKRKKEWPYNDERSLVHAGQAGPWSVRVAFDGSIIARARHNHAQTIPVPMALTGPQGCVHWDSGRACWDAMDKGWLASALTAIAQSFQGTMAVGVGADRVPEGAWPLWWRPGSWVDQDAVEHTVMGAATIAAGLLGPDSAGQNINLRLHGSSVRRDGSIVATKRIGHDHTPASTLIVRLLTPLMVRTGMVATAWSTSLRVPNVPVSPRREGAAMITPPIAQPHLFLPKVTNHDRLAIIHHYGHLLKDANDGQ